MLTSQRVTVQLPSPLGLSLTQTHHAGHSKLTVSAVRNGGPATGLVLPGDVLTHVAGAPAQNLDAVLSRIRESPDTVTLILQRPFVSQPAVKSSVPTAKPLSEGFQQSESPSRPDPDDDLYAHQDSALANLIALYTQNRHSPSEEALADVLHVASNIVKSRATTSTRSPFLISSVLNRLERAGIPLDSKFYNLCMWSYVHANQPARAAALFDEIPQPNVQCYTTLAKAYSLLRRPDDALALIPIMRREAVQPTIRTYNALIAACVRAGHLEKARMLFSEMLVDDIRPNTVSWNIIVNWHVQQKKGPERLNGALQAFADMKASGVSPNVVTFTTLMKAYTKSGLMNKAEEVFAEMKQRLPSRLDASAYNTLLAAYSSRLEWRRCLELLDEMKNYNSMSDEVAPAPNKQLIKQGVPPHSSSFSARRPWLSENRGDVRDAPDVPTRRRKRFIMDDDEDDNCAPDAISYSMVIKACADAGRPHQAQEVFQEMMERGFYPPPPPAVVSVMTGYAKAGMIREGFTMLKNLKSWGVFPEVKLLTSLMNGCITAKQPTLALAVYGKFEAARFQPDVVTHTLLLKAYGMLGQFDTAFDVLKGMSEKGPKLRANVVTYNALIESSLMHGRTDIALNSLDMLLRSRSKECQMNRQTFNALVDPFFDDYRGTMAVQEMIPGLDGPEQGARFSRLGGVRRLHDEEKLQYLVDVLRRIREHGITANGRLYYALLMMCERCDEWLLGSGLVEEKQSGGFVVSKKDQKDVRRFEDAFTARQATDRLL